MKKLYLSVMGNMGSGKTTVSKLIAKHLNFTLIEENFSQNPFLKDFYNDMERWAFHSQAFFLTEKIKQMSQTKNLLRKKSVVQDTPLYQDVHVWAEAQYESGHMKEAEFALYRKIYEMFLDQLISPDLIIYLKTSVEVIEERINARGRSFEAKVPRWYLVLLNWLLEKWVVKNKRIPVLTIETDGINIVKNSRDVEELIGKIKLHIGHI
ncbi:deoxynucleoside kinase [Candidatus Microgenomates bacterium]|nr:deoxynucleoside kinase [Candidatus Microgenomates bacterium]